MNMDTLTTTAPLDTLTTTAPLDTLTTTAPLDNVFPHKKISEKDKMTVSIMLGIFCLVGTLGNGLVLYVFTKKINKVSFTYFLLALAWTDLFTCLVTMPFTAVVVWTERYLVYDVACRGYNFLITSNVPLSVFIIAAIAVDRYFSICRPFLKVVTPRRAKIIILCLCLFAIAIGTSTAFLIGMNKEVLIKETVDRWCPNITQSLFKNSTLDDNDSIGHPQNCSRKFELVSEDGYCNLYLGTFSSTLITIHKATYMALPISAFLLVLILYVLIFRSVVRVRNKRSKLSISRGPRIPTPSLVGISDSKSKLPAKRTTGSSPRLTMESIEEDGIGVMSTLREERAERENGKKKGPNSSMKGAAFLESGRRPKFKFSIFDSNSAFGERQDFLANIRTAAMLFVVLIIFFFSFLPCGLMAVGAVNFNIVIFYMYFIHNSVNPIIYAFMSKPFREELCICVKHCFGSI